MNWSERCRQSARLGAPKPCNDRNVKTCAEKTESLESQWLTLSQIVVGAQYQVVVRRESKAGKFVSFGKVELLTLLKRKLCDFQQHPGQETQDIISEQLYLECSYTCIKRTDKGLLNALVTKMKNHHVHVSRFSVNNPVDTSQLEIIFL